MEMHKRADNGMEERKKKLQEKILRSDCTKKLVQVLCNQANLD